jgi:hypothetical protein
VEGKESDNRNFLSRKIDDFDKIFEDAEIRISNRVDNLISNVLDEISTHIEDIKAMNVFKFSMKVDIRNEEEWKEFVVKLEIILQKHELDKVFTLGHNGTDGFYNPRNNYLKKSNISAISFFHRFDEPICPCCTSGEINGEKISLEKFKCRDYDCNLPFSVNEKFAPYFGDKYPKCCSLEDYEDDESDRCRTSQYLQFHKDYFCRYRFDSSNNPEYGDDDGEISNCYAFQCYGHDWTVMLDFNGNLLPFNEDDEDDEDDY